MITSRNPVHSVLFLILAFFNAAALFLIAGAEFLAMILVIVYVGAVAVLFLFVVMMLDVNFAELRAGFQRYAPIGAMVGAILFGELALVLGGWRFAPDAGTMRLSSVPGDLENTRALGRLIYTDYMFLFQAAGLILMVAMIGAIVLTHRDRGTTGGRTSPARTPARRPTRWRSCRCRSGGRHHLPPPQAGAACWSPPTSRMSTGWASRARESIDGATIGVGHYLAVAAVLLVIGVFGIFLNRKNVIVIMMSIELILLAVNLNLVGFSSALNDLAGQAFAMFVLTVAAAEAAIGLAIVVVYFRNRGSIEVEDIKMMRG